MLLKIFSKHFRLSFSKCFNTVCELNDGPIDKFYSKLPESTENEMSVDQLVYRKSRNIGLIDL